MGQTAGRRARRQHHVFHDDQGRVKHVGGEALQFAKWFFSSKYRLMANFLGNLEESPEERDEQTLRTHYCHAVSHALRVERGRTVITALLALSVIGTALATVADVAFLQSISPELIATKLLVERVAAWSASASILLVALRLAFDRYLGLVDVSATFLAIQLANARPRAAPRG